MEDGSCQSCNCEQQGIESDGCDAKTGQCYCKPGVVGKRCDKCELPRTFLQNGRCECKCFNL